jgi:hypothetical protein
MDPFPSPHIEARYPPSTQKTIAICTPTQCHAHRIPFSTLRYGVKRLMGSDLRMGDEKEPEQLLGSSKQAIYKRFSTGIGFRDQGRVETSEAKPHAPDSLGSC